MPLKLPVDGSEMTQIESPLTISKYLSIGLQCFALSVTVRPEFQCKIMASQFAAPVWRWSKTVGPSNRNVPKFLYTLGLSCNVWPQYTVWQTDDRQAERSQ